jgi:DNA polymerase-3 subunit delta'
MQFKDIIAQQEVKQNLAELVQHNRLSHALLFIGKEGNGALPLSLAFSQYLVCETVNGKSRHTMGPSLFGEEPTPAISNKQLATESCGVCPACLKAAELVHPDIHFSYPVVTKKPGSPPISTDYIVEWREFIKSYPYGNVYDWLQFINRGILRPMNAMTLSAN